MSERQASLQGTPPLVAPSPSPPAPLAEPVAPPPPAAPGAASATCIYGWTSPGRGDPLRKAALDMIRRHRSERFVVTDIRYFRGPEDAEVVRPEGEVERWYVKAHSLQRQSRRQRWLVRRGAVGRGIDAVAPFDSTGYGPGTWRRPRAPHESLADPFQLPCDRAPSGQKCMGLPREVIGCLDGT